MTSPFAKSSFSLTSTQPATEKLILRSSNAADTMNVVTSGNVSASPDSETIALTGQREVQTTKIFDSVLRQAVASAPAGTVTALKQGTAGEGDIRIDTNFSDAEVLVIGLTGFLRTYTFKTALTPTAGEVLIGATAADSATNLAAAINAGAGSGTLYAAGTAAHEHLSAGTVATALIPITDRLACLRQIQWSSTGTTASRATIRLPLGGIDGATIGTYTAAILERLNASITLDSPTLATQTLPGSVIFESDAINVGGKGFSLYLDVEDIGSAIVWKYQTSLDGTNWRNGLTSISNGDNNAQILNPVERAEYVRLAITTNGNTGSSAVNAKIAWG